MKKDIIVIIASLLMIVGIFQVIFYEPTDPENSVDTSVGKIAYNIYGEGEKTLIAIHGSPGSKDDYHKLGPILIEYTVYALDMPGFGESTKKADNYGNDGASDAINAFMEAMDIKEADIIGYSWGGGVASTFAARHPEKINRLFLLGAVGVPESAHTQNHYTEKARYLVSYPFVMLYPGAFAPDLLNFETRYGFLRSFQDSDQRKQYQLMRTIQAPTTIIQGDTDMVVLLSGAQIHNDLIENSELFIYKGGHPELILGDANKIARGVRYYE